jgi:hypothetical protein
MGWNYFHWEVETFIQLDETIFIKKWKHFIQLDETIFLWNGFPTKLQ